MPDTSDDVPETHSQPEIPSTKEKKPMPDASDDVRDALQRLVDLADTYDPGPNQYVRDAIQRAREVLAKTAHK